MKTKLNKKFWLFAAALAFAVTLFANPVDVKAAVATPTNVKQTGASDKAVAISWNKVDRAANYGVQYSTNATSWIDVSSSNIDEYAATAEIYGLNSGNTFYVRVCAYETAAVASDWSAPIKVDTAPGMLTGLKQTDADKSTATISWTSVTGATGYEVWYAASSSSDPIFYGKVGGTSVKMSLGANSAYVVCVYPYRNVADSQKYAVDNDNCDAIVAVTIPSTPKNVNPDSRSYSSKETGFSWEPTSTANNTDGYEFEVYMLKTNGKAKRIKKVVTDSFQKNYADITSSKLFTYPCKYRVRAYVKVDGKMKYSNWSSYKQYVPGAVCKNVTYSRYGATTGTLKWSKVSGATSYTVYWKSTANGKWKAVKKNVKGTSAKVKYNSSSSNYYYVQANKVKIGKKKPNSSSLSKQLDGYMVR